MGPYIRTLEHLSGILEDFLTEIYSDAKVELYRLADLVESDERYAVADRESVAERLRQVLKLHREMDERQARSILARLNRELWRGAMAELGAGDT